MKAYLAGVRYLHGRLLARPRDREDAQAGTGTESYLESQALKEPGAEKGVP